MRILFILSVLVLLNACGESPDERGSPGGQLLPGGSLGANLPGNLTDGLPGRSLEPDIGDTGTPEQGIVGLRKSAHIMSGGERIAEVLEAPKRDIFILYLRSMGVYARVNLKTGKYAFPMASVYFSQQNCTGEKVGGGFFESEKTVFFYARKLLACDRTIS